MSMIDAISETPTAHAIGTAIVHFLWQGTVVGLGLAVMMRTARPVQPVTRYAVYCAGMVLMLLCPVATTLLLLVQGEVTGATFVDSGVVEAVFPPRTAPHVHQGVAVSALTPAVSLLWLCGVIVLQVRSVFGWHRARRLATSGIRVLDGCWEGIVAELSRALDIRCVVRIRESAVASVPMLVGWIAPVILIPAGVLSGLPPEQVRAIIAHELAHVRRHDYLVNVQQAFCESLLFFHPAVWWLSSKIRAEREFCCDDVAVAVCGDRKRYVSALASLEGLRVGDPLLAVSSGGGSLVFRIRRLLCTGAGGTRDPRIRRWSSSASVTVASILFALIGVWGCTVVATEGGDIPLASAVAGNRPIIEGLAYLPAPIQSAVEAIQREGLSAEETEQRVYERLVESLEEHPGVTEYIRGRIDGMKTKTDPPKVIWEEVHELLLLELEGVGGFAEDLESWIRRKRDEGVSSMVVYHSVMTQLQSAGAP